MARCFTPVCPNVNSARWTYCPLLSYTISLPPPLEMPNVPQKTVLGLSPFSCSYLINVAKGFCIAFVLDKIVVSSRVSMDDNHRAHNNV